jgi:hypothetical protein
MIAAANATERQTFDEAEIGQIMVRDQRLRKLIPIKR